MSAPVNAPVSSPASSPVYAVVMAGGSGVRLWPASRADHPKQLLTLGGERPLIVEALERMAGALSEPTPYAHRFVVAGRAHEAKLREVCPQLPPSHLIIEPCARNTAPCVAFAALRSVSLDYGVMEGAEGVEVVPVELGWSDVGHWAALRELYPHDAEGNVKVGASHLTLEAHDNVIYSERPVALLGVSGLAVIEANGALLVCPAERSQEVRAVVEALKAQGRGELI